MTAEHAESRVERVLFPAVCFYLGLVSALWGAVTLRALGVLPGVVVYRLVVTWYVVWAAWRFRRSALLLLFVVGTTILPLVASAAVIAGKWGHTGRYILGPVMCAESGLWCGPGVALLAWVVEGISRGERAPSEARWPHVVGAHEGDGVAEHENPAAWR